MILDSAVGSFHSSKTGTQYRIWLDSYIKFMLLRWIHKHSNDCVPSIPNRCWCILLHIVIKTFICHILQLNYILVVNNFFYLKMKWFNPLENRSGQPLPCLQTILNGVKNPKQVSTRVKSARLPITSYIRCKICHLLHSGIFDIFTSSLLEAAFSVASLDLYDVESLRF